MRTVQHDSNENAAPERTAFSSALQMRTASKLKEARGEYLTELQPPNATSNNGRQQGIEMTTENEERVRIRTIVGSEAAKQLPQLAEALAFGSDLSADAAEAALVAASADFAAAQAAADQVTVPAERMKPASSVGLGTPEPIGGGKPAVSWDGAIRRANGPDEPSTSQGVGRRTGWAKAMSYNHPAGC